MDNCTVDFSAELFEPLSAQYGEFTDTTDGAKVLIRMKQSKEETLTERANRMMKFTQIAYQDAEERESQAVQVQLAEDFIDALSSLYKKGRHSNGKSCIIIWGIDGGKRE